jgi:hypothetical protein
MITNLSIVRMNQVIDKRTIKQWIELERSQIWSIIKNQTFLYNKNDYTTKVTQGFTSSS